MRVEGWFKRLDGDRLEIFFKIENVPGVRDMKLRASGPPERMNELADWFEQQSGMTIQAPWRVKPTKVIPGQEALFTPELALGELSSDATVGADA